MPALTNIQYERYTQCVISGMTQAAAYREAYPRAKKWTDKTVYSKAWKLHHMPEIQERIKELQDEAAAAAVMDRQERLETLTTIARDEHMHPKQRMQAIDILNKMDAVYVQRVEANVHGDLSDAAAQVEAIMNE